MRRSTGRDWRTLVVCAVAALASAGSAAAQGAAGRVWIAVNGGVESSTRDFQSTLDFAVYGESGQLRTEHRVDGGGVIDGSARVRVWRNLLAGASYTHRNGTESVMITGEVPHPLRSGAPRAAGPLTVAIPYQERVLHADIGWAIEIPGVPAFDITLVGGPSLFNATHDAIVEVVVAETGPPFSDVQVRVPGQEESRNGWGGHVGLDATYMLTTNVGIGGFVRYMGGAVDLTIGAGSVSVDVRGLQGGGGIRVRF